MRLIFISCSSKFYATSSAMETFVMFMSRLQFVFLFLTFFMYFPVIKAPGVKKFLGVPIIPVTQSTTTQSAFSFSEAMKKYIQSQQKPSPSVAEPPKPASLPTYTTTKPSTTKIPTASVLSQRIRSLEKEVKGRKKSKKR